MLEAKLEKREKHFKMASPKYQSLLPINLTSSLKLKNLELLLSRGQRVFLESIVKILVIFAAR